MTHRTLSTTKVTTVMALLLACVVVVVMPAGYFAVAYQNLAGRIEAETEIHGQLMTRLISQSPELWRDETLRLNALLSLRPGDGRAEVRRLLDLSGRQLAADGPALRPPFLRRQSPVMEQGRAVARMEIVTSYSGIVHRTSLFALLGLLLGGGVFVALRILPLEAAANAEEKLREAHDFMSKVMQNSTNGIFVLDGELRVVLVNRRGAELLGVDGGQLNGRHFLELVPETPESPVREPLLALLRGETQVVQFDAQVGTHLPTPTVISCGVAPLVRRDLVTGVVVSAEDITDRKLAEQHILQMAYFDQLTGLPNRTLFSDQVESALALAQRAGGKAALMLIDLDNFKRINDTLGHRIGDEVLRIASGRMKSCLRKSDVLHRAAAEDVELVARFGGDEFTVLLSSIKEEHDPAAVAQRILEAFAQPLMLEEHEVFVTLSVGICIYPNDGTSPDILLKNADTAMYQAKFGGKNGYQFYRHSMNEKALERLTLESNLHKAVEQHDFELYYQPKLRLQTGEITGVEALIRWRHPEIGFIAPQEFIPLAEENGLIVPITCWVLNEACRQVRQWHLEGLPQLSVAVNFSTQLFKQKDLLRMVRDALHASELDPAFLELEITESVMLQDSSHTIGILDHFQQMGVSVSIDDFGTGYSSFSYLKKLPVNAIKVDRSFIKDVSKNREDVAIVKAIIATAHSLGLRVIAEGVETPDQLTFLSSQKCDEIQGYLLSRPLPAEGLARLLAERSLPLAG